VRWLVAIVAACGCRYTGTYTCERDDQCRSRAAPGTCQLPAGLCSFPDATCPLGQRYDDTAGEAAEECVGPTAMVDAPPAFDPNACPTGFMQVTAGVPSRYRVLPTLPAPADFSDYMAACDAELPGSTHGAVIDTAAEAMALAAVFGGGAGRYYIGMVQDPIERAPAAGWIHADGTPVATALWMAGEPNDGNGTETDHLEQAGVVTSGGTFNDVAGTIVAPVLCECDGAVPSAMFQTFVQTTIWR
jgi:hypothetical protein